MVLSRKPGNLSTGSQDCCWISTVRDTGWKPELGYVYTKDELNAGNLDRLGPISSISSLLARTGLSAESMMSGPESLGAAWEEAGYKAVPSPRKREPGSTVYYRGGYTVQTHGSRDGGNVDAIQLEFPGEVISDDTRRPTFAAKIGDVLTSSMKLTINELY